MTRKDLFLAPHHLALLLTAAIPSVVNFFRLSLTQFPLSGSGAAAAAAAAAAASTAAAVLMTAEAEVENAAAAAAAAVTAITPQPGGIGA